MKMYSAVPLEALSFFTVANEKWFISGVRCDKGRNDIVLEITCDKLTKSSVAEVYC